MLKYVDILNRTLPIASLLELFELWQLLILAFGATGHHSAARWWIDWQKEAYGKAEQTSTLFAWNTFRTS